MATGFLVLYEAPPAAVPVLVAYGKAGVKGCDLAVINHVHIIEFWEYRVDFKN